MDDEELDLDTVTDALPDFCDGELDEIIETAELIKAVRVQATKREAAYNSMSDEQQTAYILNLARKEVRAQFGRCFVSVQIDDWYQELAMVTATCTKDGETRKLFMHICEVWGTRNVILGDDMRGLSPRYYWDAVAGDPEEESGTWEPIEFAAT